MILKLKVYHYVIRYVHYNIIGCRIIFVSYANFEEKYHAIKLNTSLFFFKVGVRWICFPLLINETNKFLIKKYIHI